MPKLLPAVEAQAEVRTEGLAQVRRQAFELQDGLLTQQTDIYKKLL